MVENFNINRNELMDIGIIESKFGYDSRHNFEESAMAIQIIYEIIPIGNKLKIKTIKGIDKITVLIANTYRLKAVEELGLYNEHFILFSKLAQKEIVKRIERPENEFVGDELVKMVEMDLNK